MFWFLWYVLKRLFCFQLCETIFQSFPQRDLASTVPAFQYMLTFRFVQCHSNYQTTFVDNYEKYELKIWLSFTFFLFLLDFSLYIFNDSSIIFKLIQWSLKRSICCSRDETSQTATPGPNSPNDYLQYGVSHADDIYYLFKVTKKNKWSKGQGKYVRLS